MTGAEPKTQDIAYTPGPWKYDEHSLRGGMYVSSQSCAVDVALVHGGTPGGALINERVANARLIAAAPELLEALEALMPENWSPENYLENRAFNIGRARAVIQKARGQ